MGEAENGGKEEGDGEKSGATATTPAAVLFAKRLAEAAEEIRRIGTACPPPAFAAGPAVAVPLVVGRSALLLVRPGNIAPRPKLFPRGGRSEEEHPPAVRSELLPRLKLFKRLSFAPPLTSGRSLLLPPLPLRPLPPPSSGLSEGKWRTSSALGLREELREEERWREVDDPAGEPRLPLLLLLILPPTPTIRADSLKLPRLLPALLLPPLLLMLPPLFCLCPPLRSKVGDGLR